MPWLVGSDLKTGQEQGRRREGEGARVVKISGEEEERKRIANLMPLGADVKIIGEGKW